MIDRWNPSIHSLSLSLSLMEYQTQSILQIELFNTHKDKSGKDTINLGDVCELNKESPPHRDDDVTDRQTDIIIMMVFNDPSN